MKEKNGFTLVELLAVIVVLAIILIIAVPGVLGIIQQSKDKTQEQQRQMIEDAGRLYVTTDPDVVWAGAESKMTVVTLDMLKAKGYLEKKIIDPKTKKEITCAKVTVKRTGRKYDYQTEFCDQVNASPRLSSNMIPIVYKDGKWVKADATNGNNNWYNYDNQQWANMATVTEATRDAYRKANIGTEVKMEDINTMFVWIPRFKYKLFNVDGSVSPVGNPNMAEDYMIDVQLEEIGVAKSKGSQNGQWLTHPAFTFGGEELPGFWVAKFETGYKGATTTAEAEVNAVDSSKVIIKPNVYSWRNTLVAYMYQTAQGMSEKANLYGLSKVEDPHMMKNMEWGAMAYLTQSKYGKQGNSNYNGTEKQVRINNNYSFLTGCGADTQDAAGGAWEPVMGYMPKNDGTLVEDGSGFDPVTLKAMIQGEKYLDTYSFSEDVYDRSRGHLGDATVETGPFSGNQNAWYEDYGLLVSQTYPWIVRGSSIASAYPPDRSGVMAFHRSTGSNFASWGSRIVIL